jgi:hypothetical protein
VDLVQVRKRIVLAARESMASLFAGLPVSETGDEFERLSSLFQGLGICDLLTRGNVDGFRENLVRSGQSRRSFLRRSQIEGNTDSPHLALSRTEAFLDCMAAGDLVLAHEIAHLSRDTWNPNWEYEEDHYFYLFLHRLVDPSSGQRDTALRESVDRIEIVLEGAKWPQLDVLRSLLAGDEQAFTEALEAVLSEEGDTFDKKRPAVVGSKFLFWPRSFVSIQGLALLRAATLLELNVIQDFPLCPPDGRIPVSSSSYRDLFTELEEGIAQQKRLSRES